MGVRNYLIEGGSGVGKTTVAEELERQGFHVVHGDRGFAYYGDPETGEPVPTHPFDSEADNLRWAYDHWVWPLDKVRALTSDVADEMTFFCGHSANAGRFLDAFDEVFILTVDLETLDRRLASRGDDEFGGRPPERDLVVHLHATKEDLPTRGIRIDSTGPVAQVVDDILRRCAGR